MEKSYIELDVREDLRLKKEPFDKIMGAVKSLKEGQTFILHAPFNPVPLHKVLKEKDLSMKQRKSKESIGKSFIKRMMNNGCA